MDGGALVDLLGLLLLMAIPAVGLAVLFVVVDRWGRRHDPMPRTRFEFLTPKSHRKPTDEDRR